VKPVIVELSEPRQFAYRSGASVTAEHFKWEMSTGTPWTSPSCVNLRVTRSVAATSNDASDCACAEREGQVTTCFESAFLGEAWTLDRVEMLAAVAHHGQVDKAGRPYIEHPARVVQKVRNQGGTAVQIAAAWLHDVAEDTEFTMDVLTELGTRAGSGLSTQLLAVIDALTARPGEPREDYYRRVRSVPDALVVKLADIDDNSDPSRLAQLDADTRHRLNRKYSKARAALLG
jgi:hypothetical protein